MVSDGQLTDCRSILHRRRCWPGNDIDATPFLRWKLGGGDRHGAGDGRAASVSARKLAAALWRWAETTDGGGGRQGWQCCLIRRLGFEIPQLATEGVTKWDHLYSTASNDASYSPLRVEHPKRREIAAASVASRRRVKVSRSRKIGNEVEPEDHRMMPMVKNLKDSVTRETKICKKIDRANSKLVHDIAEVKSSARKVINNLQKEKRARLLVEDVCIELAKEIEANGAEIDALRKQRKRIEEEVAKERKMLQLAEIWREERAQIKLKEVNWILERKYAEMSHLIAKLQNISRNSDLTQDATLTTSIANILRRDPEPINIQVTKEFPHLLPKSDHKVKIIKEYSQRRKEEGKNALSGRFSDGDLETVTQAEVSSSQNLGGISHEERSACKIRRSKHPKSDSSGITSVSMKQPKKKGSHACKVPRNLARNKEACKRIPINAHDLSSNPHVVRAMKGHIEWPREIRRPGSGAGNLLEAKLQNQKTLLRNILKRRSS